MAPAAPTERERDLSPRQLAEALGVSESSVKRWCDDGRLAFVRTAGGHRRMPLTGVVAFLRAQGLDPVRPDLLGLPAGAHRDAGALERFHARLGEALRAGDEDGIAATLLGLYLGGRTIADLADQLIAPAFTALGHGWERGEVEVYVEHRAVERCTRALHALGTLLPAPPKTATRALLATLAGDPYSLPLDLAELALREVGVRATSLGPGHPVDTLIAAIAAERPRLLAIAVNAPGVADGLPDAAARLFAAARSHGVALVLGGRAIVPDRRAALACTAICDSMTGLASLAAALSPVGRRAR